MELKTKIMSYKSIPGMLSWLEDISEMNWILLDTETTGLKGSKIEQLTQISAKLAKYSYTKNDFLYIEDFDEKIALTDKTFKRYDIVEPVLEFNHYKDGRYDYKDENVVLDKFFDFIKNSTPSLLVAQNAPFDVDMLTGRHGHEVVDEVFDTKMLIRLYLIPILQKLSETDDYYTEVLKTIGISDRDGGLVSSSLSKIGPALGINMEGYHDALTDCAIMGEVCLSIFGIMKCNSYLNIEKYQIERVNVLTKNKEL
jgi:DNA polymerase III epsilon subunit-like protein